MYLHTSSLHVRFVPVSYSYNSFSSYVGLAPVEVPPGGDPPGGVPPGGVPPGGDPPGGGPPAVVPPGGDPPGGGPPGGWGPHGTSPGSSHVSSPTFAPWSLTKATWVNAAVLAQWWRGNAYRSTLWSALSTGLRTGHFYRGSGHCDVIANMT